MRDKILLPAVPYNGHVRYSPQDSVPPVYDSDSGAITIGGGCSTTSLTGTVDILVYSVCFAEQGLSTNRMYDDS